MDKDQKKETKIETVDFNPAVQKRISDLMMQKNVIEQRINDIILVSVELKDVVITDDMSIQLLNDCSGAQITKTEK